MGSKFDYYSPFFRAAIITDPTDRAGSRWPLWVFGSPEDTKRLSGQMAVNGLNGLAFCTEISVTLNLGYIPTITATLNPPIADARKLIESQLVEWTSSILTVMFGYTNGPNYTVLSPEFEGNIQQPEVSFGTDATITLKGQGTGASLAIKEEITKIFSKTSRLEMIKDVLKPYGLDVDSSTVKGAELTALNEKPESEFTSNQSPWFFALKTANLCRCWMYLENTTVKLIPRELALGAEPKFKFVFYDHKNGVISPQTDDFPILGISTSTPAVFLSGATKALRLHGYDSKTREIKTDEVIEDGSPGTKRNNDGSVPDSKSPTPGDLFSENIADPAQKDKAKQAFQNAIGGMGVTIEVETLGIPTLFPGALVSISGVAKNRLDMNYVVMNVTHTVGSNGYTTTFTAITNISQFSAQLGFGEPVKNPNTQTKNSSASQATTTNNSTVTVQPKAG